MSQDLTSNLLCIAEKLKERNALDSETLLALAKSEQSAKLLVSCAQNLTSQELLAYSRALDKISESVDWARVKRTLGQWAIEKKAAEVARDEARDDTAPLWNFSLQNGMLSGEGAHACEFARIGDDGEPRYLLRINEKACERLRLIEDGKSTAEYSLDPDWSANICLAVHRDGKTFVPISRSIGGSECRLICLESNEVLVSKVDKGWSQPIGLLWHRRELVLLIARWQTSVNGISHIDIASLLVNRAMGGPEWVDLDLSSIGTRIWWIGGVHTHGDEVRALVETSRGFEVCRLFARL
jgi:hypothetical protein